MFLLFPLLLLDTHAGEAWDVSLSFEGALYDQSAQAWTQPFRFVVEGYEWVDASGAHLELKSGRGAVPIDGVDVPLAARVERYPHVGLLSAAEGGRTWSLRGDLYLEAEGHPMVEFEAGLQVDLPADGRRSWAPPVPPEGDVLAGLAARSTELTLGGRGGALVFGAPVPLWGRPVPQLPYLGTLALVAVEVRPTTVTARERDADRLLSRVLYVGSDYKLAVDGGVVIHPGEFTEQLRLLQEARVIAEGLALSAARREELAQLKVMVGDQVDPSLVEARCAALAEALRAELGQIATPVAGAGDRGPALYALRCASCHGARGEGPPPGLALDPSPPAFAAPGATDALSPYRAFAAITWGVDGTAMPAFDAELDEAERWALAFAVLALAHADAPRRPGSGLDLATLATLSDAALADRVGPEERAWWWTEGAPALLAAAAPRPSWPWWLLAALPLMFAAAWRTWRRRA